MAEKGSSTSVFPPDRNRGGSAEAIHSPISPITVCGQSHPHHNLPKTTVTQRVSATRKSAPNRTR